MKSRIHSIFFSMIIAVSGIITPLSYSYAVMSSPANDPVCGFEEKDGRVIVDFKTGENGRKLNSNGDEAKASIEKSAVIPAGYYDVTLVSYDSNRGSGTQEHEEWFTILKDGEGNEIVRTNKINDLPDDLTKVRMEEKVNEGMLVAKEAVSATAFHAAYPSDESNSVRAICAVFDKVADYEPEPVVISATKLVCDSEADLPNWGNGGPNISISTAADWAAQNNCRPESGWYFQWGYGGEVSDPGSDFYGEADGNWNTFGPTDENGVAVAEIDDDNLDSASKIWVREVLQEGYIPFTHPSDDEESDVSAEMYCANDVLNYDNYDYIANPDRGNTYYCVAFNAPMPPANQPPTITLLGDNPITVTEGDEFTDPGATASDPEDGDITADIVVGGDTISTTTPPGTYTITYNVTDSEGLAADEVTRTVVVEEKQNQCSATIAARVVIDDVKNWNGGDMTNTIYLGGTTTTVASGEWFPLYENGAYITDPDMSEAGYEDVPGLALQRLSGSVRVLMYGSHRNGDKGKEHVDGYIEFAGAELTGVRSDSGKGQGYSNVLERGDDGSGVGEYRAGNDEVWQDDGLGKFWLTVTVADDGFYADYSGVACPYENQKPVITLLGDQTIFVQQGDTFVDPGATASDPEDGDITDQIVVGGMTVDTSTAGSYVIRYNVTDSEGLAADEVMRLVVVEKKSTPPAPNQKPVITLSATSTTITVGDDFDPLDGYATASDPEDGDITSNIVASSTVATTTPGIYTVVYNVTDSAGLAADPKTLTVFVVAPSANQPPTITLLGDNPITITEGDEFTDPGATATDPEDGDITADIVVGGDTISTTTPPGTYTITYNVTDSEGLAADEVTRTVVVEEKAVPPVEPPVTPACTGNCGGGGGGGPIPDTLRIFNEKIERISDDAVLVTWETDKPATSRVVYDTISHKVTTYGPNAGYASSTVRTDALITLHALLVTGLSPDTQYFFRPVSTRGTMTKIGNELTFAPPSIPGQCSYLKDYLRMGDANDPEEVKKLQVFLRDYEGFEDVEVTGVFDQKTFDAVAAFQAKYADEVLTPWGIKQPTGYVYYTTQKKINEIYCNAEFPLNESQLAEIERFRELITELREAGAGGVGGPEETIDFNAIGRAETTPTPLPEGASPEGGETLLAAGEEEGGAAVTPIERTDTESQLASAVSGGVSTTTTEAVKKSFTASVFDAMKNGFGSVIDSFKRFFSIFIPNGNDTKDRGESDETNTAPSSEDTTSTTTAAE